MDFSPTCLDLCKLVKKRHVGGGGTTQHGYATSLLFTKGDNSVICKLSFVKSELLLSRKQILISNSSYAYESVPKF